jgi:hypothetical protein
MMRHAAMGVLILSAIGVGSAFAQTSTPNTNPPTVTEPAKPATPDDRRADASHPRDGVITPAPGAPSDMGTTVHPPNVDPGINVVPPGSVGGSTKVVPK